MKRIGKFLLIFLMMIMFFIVALKLSCSFPSLAIKKSVASSSKILSKEGNRKTVFIINKFQFQEFDNYSDSLMINTAYSIDYKTPLYSAFTAKKDYIPGITKKIEKDTVGELKSNSKYKLHDEVSELEDTVNGIGSESFEYAKYWHGYLILLRPLLLFLDYNQIRILLTIILAILAITVTTAIAKKQNTIIASFYMLALFSVEYFYIGLTLINSIMFLIMMISSLILVEKFQNIKDFNLFFFIIGICVGFFGLLDIPLITFGGPLILYFVFKNGDGTGNIKDTIKLFIFWVLGYFLTWMTKWVLMDLIYHRNLIKTALEQVLYRSVGGGVSPILAICLNLLSMALPIMISICLMWYMFVKYNAGINKESRKKARIFILISSLPILWYIVLPNHSANHFFFAYRLPSS